MDLQLEAFRRDTHNEYSTFLAFARHFGEIAYPNKAKINEDKIKLIFHMRNSLNNINHLIIHLNSALSPFERNLKVKPLQVKNISKEVNPFFESSVFKVYDANVIQHLVHSFDSYTNKKIQSTYNSIKEISQKSLRYQESFAIEKIDKIYRANAYEIVDLLLMGYGQTALMVLGRTFEQIFTKYLIQLSKEKKMILSKDEILKMKFEHKLGRLHSQRYISYKDWLILSKVRLDRNTGAHYATNNKKLEAEQEAEATVKMSLRLLNKFGRKLK